MRLSGIPVCVRTRTGRKETFLFIQFLPIAGESSSFFFSLQFSSPGVCRSLCRKKPHAQLLACFFCGAESSINARRCRTSKLLEQFQFFLYCYCLKNIKTQKNNDQEQGGEGRGDMRLPGTEIQPYDKKNLIQPAFIFLTRLKKLLTG